MGEGGSLPGPPSLLHQARGPIVITCVTRQGGHPPQLTWLTAGGGWPSCTTLRGLVTVTAAAAPAAPAAAEGAVHEGLLAVCAVLTHFSFIIFLNPHEPHESLTHFSDEATEAQRSK